MGGSESSRVGRVAQSSIKERIVFCKHTGYLSAFQADGLDHWENIGDGMIDFAGSGVVHMTGGVAALIGSAILGPRTGRFDSDGTPVSITPHSAALSGLGVLFLWFGWYGFNPGSTLALSGGFHFVAGKVAVTTTLAAAAGGSTALLIHFLCYQEFNLYPALNVRVKGGLRLRISSIHRDCCLDFFPCSSSRQGVLGGLVAICSGTAAVEPWASVLIGFLAAGVYTAGSRLLIKFQIDDPLDASPVHFLCGLYVDRKMKNRRSAQTLTFLSFSPSPPRKNSFGLYATAFLATETNIKAAYGIDERGLFYGGDGTIFLANFAGSFLITIWVGVTSLVLFATLKFTGIFRVPKEEEEEGKISLASARTRAL